MERKSFTYEVNADIEFSAEELLKLAELSQSHYDGVCRSASMQGNFLYGALNGLRLRPDKPTLGISLSSNELQTLAKIAEGENVYALAGGMPILGPLGRQLRQILNELYAESRRLNNPTEVSQG